MKKPLFTTAFLYAASIGICSAAVSAPNENANPTPGAALATPNNNANATPGAALGATNNNANPTPSASPSPVTPYTGFLLGSKIIGSHINNLQNDDIGTIDDLIVNPDTGRVRFAVLSVGGFLGVGNDKIIVPWQAVGLQKNRPGEAPSYVIDVSKDKLQKAPKFDANKLTDLFAKTTAQPIFDYFTITYFEDVPAPGQAQAQPMGKTPSPTPGQAATPAVGLSAPTPVTSPTPGEAASPSPTAQ
ncbi:MAG: PRC-barrel domain-containing protein [Verrucomicrobia bacterium]|nr:PRC-barrel domain-containing protein [Verrucomicrobiota bacterium]MBV9672657.1 PRC-barrel domain-containing protein [Verrucomicrobiota bacterium]